MKRLSKKLGMSALAPLSLVSLVSCPGCIERPPPICIEYPRQGSDVFVSVVKLEPPADSLRFGMTGCGRFKGTESYELRIDIHVARTGGGEWLVVRPDNVSVRFEGEKMSPKGGRPSRPDSTRDDEFRKTLDYEMEYPRLGNMERAPSDMPGQGAIVTIVMNGFLYYDGSPVKMDTIHAVEKGAGQLWSRR